ncbi:STY4528 family pathogenicity island replication protein [Mannheimia haemolytica]|uniref:STY4528 family pathogenicity island replication protein n=1 Tax=Mannheimia haemolytica TaxID=75985 RepID=UPI0025A2EDA7|nr:STY4528 family pathogenicity island replication protein [Mannheimia haemolytica]
MFNRTNTSTEHGLLFFGNQHETVPTRLLQDPCLTPRAKFAWQLIKCNAQAFQGALFPSYETLSKMLSDRPYADAKLSEKVVTQTLYLLRLTRWLTLCETVRDERGYVQGNVYILHDEPVPILDAIQLNSDYLSFLDKCTKHKDSLINGVANHIVESLMTDKTKWHYVSHLDCLQSRYQAHQNQKLEKDKQLSKTEQALSKIQQDILTSTMEVRDFDEEVRKKSSKSLASNKEVRGENADKSLILDLLPLGKSDVQYSTLYINKYCTGEPSEISWPVEIPLTSLEQKLTALTMKGLDLGLCQAILLEVQQRIIQKQDVKKPKGYLYTLIQRAKQGEFKPYYFELGKNLPSQNQNTNNSIQTTQILTESVTEKKPVLSQVTREHMASRMQQFRAELLSR